MREFIHETIDLGYNDLDADTQSTGRTYVTPDGTRYPSITTVLSILSEEAIAKWRARVGEEEATTLVSPEPSPTKAEAVTVPERLAPVAEIVPEVMVIPSNCFAKRATGT